MDLQLEVNEGIVDKTARIQVGRSAVLMTPLVSPDYWAFRVKVSAEQAILGFPKFGTIGIGFAVEDDWNTNLPCQVEAEQIWEHIAHNKGDDAIPAERCLAAIRMIQDVARPLAAIWKAEGR